MRRTALQDYLSQIEGLLDDNRLPEAVAHCHFILQQYPRHVDTYRLFGRALLEQQQFDAAADVFERLLSADPEDLIALAGLALAYNERQELKRAIWYMERAFEIDPYNKAIQGELRKLYIKRDGDAPPRLALTRAALARLLFRGALFRQAIAEFRRLVAENPQRFDIQLALADTYYWASRNTEAADVCQNIVEHLPFCIKANAILADIWLRGGRSDEAREYLRRIQTLTLLDRSHLDPGTTLGRALSNSRIQLPDMVQVQVLDGSRTSLQPPDDGVEWSAQATAGPADAEQVPEWLLEIASPDLEPTDKAGLEPEQEEVSDWIEASTIGESLLVGTVDDARETESDQDETVGDFATASTVVEQETASAEVILPTGADADTAAGEPPDEDEFWSVEPVELGDSLGDEVRTVAVSESPVDMLGEPSNDAADGSLADQAMVQGGSEAPTGEWDDETLLALDDLKSYIDTSADTAAPAESAQDWLGELESGDDVSAEELPDWLYETSGDLVPTGAEDEGQEPDWLREIPADAMVPIDEDSDQAQVESRFAATADESAGASANDLEDLVVNDKAVQDTPAGEGEVPEWLLAADDVLEEFPEGLLEGSEKDEAESSGREDRTVTWLDELTDQLGIADEDSGPYDRERDG